MTKEQSSYDNRAMQSGHPAGTSTCPNCNAPLYYAAELKLHDRTEKNVVYCSGGCGWLDRVKNKVEGVVKEGVKEGVKEAGRAAKDAGVAALEVAADIAVSNLGAFQE